MRSRWYIAVPLVVATLAAGCATTVGGTARPAAELTPRPLTGRVVNQVLLDGAALSKLLHQPLMADPHFPPRFGGPEKLQDDGLSSPVDCLGVALMLRRSVYQTANLQDVAIQSWSQTALFMNVISVKEGVVTFPSAADADAFFAETSRQWQKCNGRELRLPGRVLRLTPKISNVRVGGSVIAASVSMGMILPELDSGPMPEERALGVRGNCLVEVRIDFFSPSHQGLSEFNTSAADIAYAMLDKASALS